MREFPFPSFLEGGERTCFLKRDLVLSPTGYSLVAPFFLESPSFSDYAAFFLNRTELLVTDQLVFQSPTTFPLRCPEEVNTPLSFMVHSPPFYPTAERRFKFILPLSIRGYGVFHPIDIDMRAVFVPSLFDEKF